MSPDGDREATQADRECAIQVMRAVRDLDAATRNLDIVEGLRLAHAAGDLIAAHTRAAVERETEQLRAKHDAEMSAVAVYEETLTQRAIRAEAKLTAAEGTVAQLRTRLDAAREALEKAEKVLDRPPIADPDLAHTVMDEAQEILRAALSLREGETPATPKHYDHQR
jgi:hypothetical protein